MVTYLRGRSFFGSLAGKKILSRAISSVPLDERVGGEKISATMILSRC